MNSKNIEALRKNYFSQFSYATGFVRPKTTALFFDKLWAPYEIRKTHYGKMYDMYSMPKSICLTGKDVSDSALFEGLEEKLYLLMQSKSIMDLQPDDSLRGFKQMLLSENRNKGLIRCSQVFKKYFDINMIPIMVDKTRYELDVERYNKHFRRIHNMELPSEEKTITSSDILELTVHALPIAVDEKLSWEQVMEFRDDKAEVAKLRRFLSWADKEFDGKSKLQIQDELGNALDDYKYALKKYGIETVSSGITTVMSSSVTILSALNDIQSAGTAVGLTVTAGLITYFVKVASDKTNLSREPIAYIYDVLNETDKWWKKRH